MVQLRYLTDCDVSVQEKVSEWTHADDFAARIGPPFYLPLGCAPGAEIGGGRVHNWIIYADEQPVGLVAATVLDQPRTMFNKDPDDPSDYPLLGMVTYIDPEHRCNGYASAAKRAIAEHDAANGVRAFGCVIAADNTASLKSIQKAGYERIGIEKVAGKPDNFRFRLRRRGDTERA